jgi:hypothetical protein
VSRDEAISARQLRNHSTGHDLDGRSCAPSVRPEFRRPPRDALFAFIKEARIGGVVLFGGDIHVARLLHYPAEFVGYPLYVFISSPMHARVIPSLAPHPYLLESKVQPNTFLTLTADSTARPVTLMARFLDKDGRSLFSDTTITADELGARSS